MNTALHPHELAVRNPLLVRPVDPQPSHMDGPIRNTLDNSEPPQWWAWLAGEELLEDCEPHCRITCPWKPGDVIGVLEEWCPLRASDYAAAPRSARLPRDREKVVISYRSDHFDPEGDAGPLEWRPASTLPEWAIRRRLRVESVECRRVQGVTHDEAEASGFNGQPQPGSAIGWIKWPSDEFAAWWDSAFPATPWASNPWAWFAKTSEVSG